MSTLEHVDLLGLDLRVIASEWILNPPMSFLPYSTILSRGQSLHHHARLGAISPILFFFLPYSKKCQ